MTHHLLSSILTTSLTPRQTREHLCIVTHSRVTYLKSRCELIIDQLTKLFQCVVDQLYSARYDSVEIPPSCNAAFEGPRGPHKLQIIGCICPNTFASIGASVSDLEYGRLHVGHIELQAEEEAQQHHPMQLHTHAWHHCREREGSRVSIRTAAATLHVSTPGDIEENSHKLRPHI